MAGVQFAIRATARTAQEAFANAVSAARAKVGDGGYSGTIAEKLRFEMVAPHESEKPVDCVRRIQRLTYHETQSTYGPAGCVELGPGQARGERTFIFFGWAAA